MQLYLVRGPPDATLSGRRDSSVCLRIFENATLSGRRMPLISTGCHLSLPDATYLCRMPLISTTNFKNTTLSGRPDATLSGRPKSRKHPK